MRSNVVPSLVLSTGRWVAVGAVASLLIAGAATGTFSPKSALAADPTSTTPEHTISVTGQGIVNLTPDTSDISLGVTVQKSTAADARNAAAEAMNLVIAAVKKDGVADADIQTTNLSLQPVYDNNPNVNGGQGKIIGYQVNNEISVVVRDLTKVGTIVDTAVTAGATSVDGIDFRVANQGPAEMQARAAAVADAKSKATELANAAGVTITGVSSIDEESSIPPTPVAFAGAAAPRADSTPIQPGTTSITVTVTIVYVID